MNRGQGGRWRRTARIALDPGASVTQAARYAIAGAANTTLCRQRAASAVPCLAANAWPGPSTWSAWTVWPRRQPNPPAHGSRGRARPQLRGHTDTPDLRPGTAQTSAAAWQAKSRTQKRQHCTGRRARSAACGSKRQESCMPAWSWPAYRSTKGLRETMAKKSRRQGRAQRAKIAFAIVQVAKMGI